MIKWFRYDYEIITWYYFQIGSVKKIASIRIRIEIFGWIRIRIQLNTDPKHCHEQMQLVYHNLG